MNSFPNGGSHRVLLIEGDPRVHDVLREVLIDAEYDVLECELRLDPADVLNLQPDLIVLAMPPGRDTRELRYVSELKTGVHTAHVPILALGKSLPSPDITAWMKQKGIAGFLRKPFDIEVFQNAVQAAIETASPPAPVGRKDAWVPASASGATPQPNS